MRTLLLAVALMVCPCAAHEPVSVQSQDITLPYIFVSGPEKELKVEWAGYMVIGKEKHKGVKVLTNIKVGIREDGVVVWRKAKEIK